MIWKWLLLTPFTEVSYLMPKVLKCFSFVFSFILFIETLLLLFRCLNLHLLCQLCIWHVCIGVHRHRFCLLFLLLLLLLLSKKSCANVFADENWRSYTVIAFAAIYTAWAEIVIYYISFVIIHSFRYYVIISLFRFLDFINSIFFVFFIYRGFHTQKCNSLWL